MEVVVSHSSTDFDSLAAMVAATKLYPEAAIVLVGSLDQHVRAFMALHREWIPTRSVREIDLEQVTRLIVVDTREASRLGAFRNLVNRPDVELHIYDHHPTSYKDLVGDVNMVREVGSTTTILVDLLRDRRISITSLEATLFVLGIYIDTGCLTFPTTTVTDVKCVAWLLESGANLELISAHIHQTLTPEQRELLTTLITAAEYHHLHGYDILLTSASVPKFIDELALLTHKLLDLERMDAVFSVVAMRDRLYLVGRSTSPGLDVNQVLIQFGGGGHATAAAAAVRSLDVAGHLRRLWEVVREKVRPLLTAREVMSTPVHSVPPDTAIADVQRELLRFGHGGILVIEGGDLVGTISRRDVDKAIHHGYGHAPVRAYMSKALIVAAPATPLPDVQDLMVTHDVGRIPIVEEGKVIGIVTRTDILRTLGSKGMHTATASQHLQVEDFHLLSPGTRRLLREIGEVGDELGMPVFVVGGVVRDLLLGTPTLDLDIVVEGSGIAFAEALGARKRARVHTHEKFGTAAVTLGADLTIDVATARSEFYARPAALPDVVGTSLKQDLHRRDFSINAMAIKLNPADFGKIIDFFGGMRDLQHGVVRILHNLSFLEDPTRVFRAVRFEQRYRFRMEHGTERLLKEAVASGVFGKITYDRQDDHREYADGARSAESDRRSRLSAERIRDELVLILSEENPLPALKRMGKLKLLPLLHPRLRLDHKGEALLDQIHHTLAVFRGGLARESMEGWLVYLLGLSTQLAPEEAAEMVDRLRFSAAHRRQITADRTAGHQVLRRLGHNAPFSPSGVAAALEPYPLETLLFLYARAASPLARERLARYLLAGRHVSSLVKGDDLLRLGVPRGPALGALLKEIRAAQLDGTVRSREEGIALARKKIERE